MFIQPLPGRQGAPTGQCKHPDCLSAWWGAEASWGTSNQGLLVPAWCWRFHRQTGRWPGASILCQLLYTRRLITSLQQIDLVGLLCYFYLADEETEPWEMYRASSAEAHRIRFVERLGLGKHSLDRTAWHLPPRMPHVTCKLGLDSRSRPLVAEFLL